MKEQHFTLLNKTGSNIPSLSFALIKNAVLGKKYELSVVFIGESRAKKLNQLYRDKNYIPDILSFPLSTEAGEIFICPKAALRKMKEFQENPSNTFDSEIAKNFPDFLTYLFIHGLLHLNGMEHGSTMDRAEKKFSKKFIK